jgi:hypothetical protein
MMLHSFAAKRAQGSALLSLAEPAQFTLNPVLPVMGKCRDWSHCDESASFQPALIRSKVVFVKPYGCKNLCSNHCIEVDAASVIGRVPAATG